MKMDRRRFLQNSLMMVGAAYLDLPTFAQEVKALGAPKLRIGILSDIHITGKENTDVFQHTLEYFRDQDVDGVLMAGDLADWGFDYQLQEVANTWYRVFPKDKANGHKVEKLFIYGNHDIDAYAWGVGQQHGMSDEDCKREAIGLHREKTWKKCFKEDFKPVYMKTVKGYHFIGGHWQNGNNMPGLKELLDANREKLSDGKPFFYFQHPHLRYTCNGDDVWGHDGGETTQLLSQFPNAVAFSGHSHMPLGDDRDLWQGAFTSIGTSSLSYQCLIGARENTLLDGENRKVPSQMPNMSTSNGKQGMLMCVYDNCITLERREFVYDQPVADNWIIPLPLGKGEPLSFANRARTAKVPEFGANDKVTITRAVGKDRYGEEQPQVTVHFPSVLKKTHGVRAFDYEVQVEYKYVDLTLITATKHVLSKGNFLGEAQDTEEVICVYGEKELPDFHEMRFIVRPCECYGKKGKPIFSEWFKKSTDK